jgi:RimJ/RimL family protein N-acetyltransferase
MRLATAADIPAITRRLLDDAESAMFPLANLAAHGIAGGHPRAMTFWIAGDPPTDIVGITEEGMVMPLLSPAAAPAAANALSGRAVTGMAGAAAGLRALAAACGLSDAPVKMSQDEPHFALRLSDLVMPDCGDLRLIPAREAARDLLIGWRSDYDVEVLGGTPEAARAEAAATLDGWLAADSHRVLMRGGLPVALTGFNARLPDIVQVGGVWTPPALRGQGLARRAVALHLAEARAQGVTRATLFSASDKAARAYRAIGFRQIGIFALILFRDRPQVSPP